MNYLEDGNNFCSLSEHNGKKTIQSGDLVCSSGLIQPPAGSSQAKELLKSAELLRWGFIVIEPRLLGEVDYGGIISLIEDYGRAMGMTVAQPVVQQFYLQLQDLGNLLEKCKENYIRMLFVVIPRGNNYHCKIKQMVDREMGIVTQCIREQTARKFMRLCIIKSIMMKVNLKLVGHSSAHSSSIPSFLRVKRVMDVEDYDTYSSCKQKKVIVILVEDVTL